MIWEYGLDKLEAYLDAARYNEIDDLSQLVRVQHDPKGILKEMKQMLGGSHAISTQDASRLQALSRSGGKRGRQ